MSPSLPAADRSLETSIAKKGPQVACLASLNLLLLPAALLRFCCCCCVQRLVAIYFFVGLQAQGNISRAASHYAAALYKQPGGHGG